MSFVSPLLQSIIPKQDYSWSRGLVGGRLTLDNTRGHCVGHLLALTWQNFYLRPGWESCRLGFTTTSYFDGKSWYLIASGGALVECDHVITE